MEVESGGPLQNLHDGTKVLDPEFTGINFGEYQCLVLRSFENSSSNDRNKNDHTREEMTEVLGSKTMI